MVHCCSRLSVLPRPGELYLSSRVHKPPERPRSASSTRGGPQDQAHIFRENEENNTAEEISWPWSLNKHACNTSDLRSKLKLVNTLKRKVFKKKNLPAASFHQCVDAFPGMPRTAAQGRCQQLTRFLTHTHTPFCAL